MKKTFLITAFTFITGFLTGFVFSDCTAQTVSDNSVSIVDEKAVYTNPEVYELMQVAIALTDTAIVTNNVKMYTNNVETTTAYYREVMEVFGRFKNHALIRRLNKSFSKSAINYVYQLQKAFNAGFGDKGVKKNSQMPLFRRIWIGFNSVSRAELEKFAVETNFRNFYKRHLPYYNAMLADVKNKLAVPTIQAWLEKQFTARYDKYTIVVSPLANAFHFTQHFNYKGDKTTVIWIGAATGFDTLTTGSSLAAASYAGVAFTEIDHNYVNPATDKYKKEVNEIMGGNNRKNWVDESGDAALYSTGYAVFNEYMTHAVYLLYIKETYGEKVYETVLANKVKGMTARRKYYRFGAFYNALLQCFQNRRNNQLLADLYPAILQWCKTQNQ
jgi:Domain of unknown function (DUF4932)